MEPTQEAQPAPPPTEKKKTLKEKGCAKPLVIFLSVIIALAACGLCSRLTKNSDTPSEPFTANVQKNVAQLVITPTTTYAWHDVTVTVNDKFEAKIPVMQPNEPFTIGFARLSDDEGNIFGLGRVVKIVEIRCTEGSNTWSFE